MEHERRDVNLGKVVEALQEAAAAGDLRALHHLLADDVVLHGCRSLAVGADAVVRTLEDWAEEHGRDWHIAEVVNGGDRLALRFTDGQRHGALFLTADDDGLVAVASVTPSAA